VAVAERPGEFRPDQSGSLNMAGGFPNKIRLRAPSPPYHRCMELLGGILVSVLAVGVVACIRALWVRRQRFIRLFSLHPFRNLTQRRNRKREAREVDRRINEAHGAGKVLPIFRSGREPTAVKWSDDSVSYYFCGDLIAYKDALRSGRYPHDRSFHGKPPLLISERVRLDATG
jgi:hypothetical protein